MDSVNDLMEAMQRVRLKVGRLPKDGRNPHFHSKFTTLEALTDRVLPVLDSEGLTWTTLPGHYDGAPTLAYTLLHLASGQSLRGEMPLMLAKSEPQGLGSALTYARRYTLTTVLGLVADEDDDGHAGSANSNTSSVVSLAELAYGKSPEQVGDAFTRVGLQVPPDPFKALANVPEQWQQPLREALSVS